MSRRTGFLFTQRGSEWVMFVLLKVEISRVGFGLREGGRTRQKPRRASWERQTWLQCAVFVAAEPGPSAWPSHRGVQPLLGTDSSRGLVHAAWRNTRAAPTTRGPLKCERLAESTHSTRHLVFRVPGPASDRRDGPGQWPEALGGRDPGEPGLVSDQRGHGLRPAAARRALLSRRALVPGVSESGAGSFYKFVTSVTFVIKYSWGYFPLGSLTTVQRILLFAF